MSASQGNPLSRPKDTPGIDVTGANAACRVICRRASSAVKLLAASSAVLISSSASGSWTGIQS